MDQFYLTLLSNASMTKYDNTKSNFTTLLNNPLQLNGKYEIGIVDFTSTANLEYDFGNVQIVDIETHYPFFTSWLPRIIIPFTFSPLLNSSIIITRANEIINDTIMNAQININSFIFYNNFSAIENNKSFISFELSFEKHKNLPVFYYIDKEDNYYYIPYRTNTYLNKNIQNIDKIMSKNCIKISQDETDTLNSLFKLKYYPISMYNRMTSLDKLKEFLKTIKPADYNKKPHEHYNTADIRFERNFSQIKVTGNNWYDSLPIIEINGILNELIFKTGKIIYNNAYTIPSSFDVLKYIAIYTDIIEPQYTGDTIAQIIDIIPFDTHSEQKFFKYKLNNIHYVPIKTNFINTINISIKDLFGNLVHFADDFIYTIIKFHIRKQ